MTRYFALRAGPAGECRDGRDADRTDGTDEQVERLRAGVMLNDGLTRPAEVTRLRGDQNKTFLEITIREGRNRQVRRMLEAVDSKVRKLVRTGIGPLRIDKLEVGKYRALTNDEVLSLVVGPVERSTPYKS